MSKLTAAAALVLTLSSPIPLLADAPLPLPARHVVCSASGRRCAISDPATNTTTLRIGQAGPVLWSMPGWHRYVAVADAAPCIVVGPDGMNLLPLNATSSEPILRFYCDARLVRTIPLGALLPNGRGLRRTASHYHWGGLSGFDSRGHLKVTLATGKVVHFDPTSGTLSPGH